MLINPILVLTDNTYMPINNDNRRYVQCFLDTYCGYNFDETNSWSNDGLLDQLRHYLLGMICDNGWRIGQPITNELIKQSNNISLMLDFMGMVMLRISSDFTLYFVSENHYLYAIDESVDTTKLVGLIGSYDMVVKDYISKYGGSSEKIKEDELSTAYYVEDNLLYDDRSYLITDGENLSIEERLNTLIF